MQKSSVKSRRNVGQQAQIVAQSAKETLLKSGRKLFARKGLSGTSIRDIASEANMNSSQISYYFESKEGLYRACIQEIAESRIGFAEQILAPPATSEEFRIRLNLFVENMMSYFLDDRDTGLILIREFDRAHSPSEKVFKAYFSRLFELLMRFMDVAKKKGYTNRRGDSLQLTSLLLGTIISELRFDHIKESLFNRSINDTNERKRVIEAIVGLFADT